VFGSQFEKGTIKKKVHHINCKTPPQPNGLGAMSSRGTAGLYFLPTGTT